MKKTLAFVFIFAFALSLALTKKASAIISEEEMQGDPMNNENHFIWDVMAQLQTPDDPDCADVAEAALLAGGVDPENVAGPRDGACSGMASMRTSMESGMSEGDEATETNLFDAADWHNVENLYFQHSSNDVADGRIAFTVPIDFMSYNFLTFMMNFGNAMETGDGLIGLDADIVGGMAGYGAVLTMYNVDDFENPKILVDGEEDNEGIVSNLVYDREAHTITFNAAHFTEFEVVESEGERADIDSWKAYKYADQTNGDCRTKLRVEIKGHDFENDAEVKIGNTEASSVDKKSSRKLVAKFCLAKLLDVKTGSKRVIKVKNPDADTEKASKKIDLNNLFFKLTGDSMNIQTVEGVKNIQQALFQKGLLDAKYITGYFGPITTNAVIEFQKQKGLPQTGFFGPLTKTALEKQ